MTETPYTDDDLRHEAARQLIAHRSRQHPNATFAAMLDADIESTRTVPGDDGLTWDEALACGDLDTPATAVHKLIEGAADLSVWAVNLGADGLEPSRDEITIDTEQGSAVRLLFAFTPTMPEALRALFVRDLRAAIDAQDNAAREAVDSPPPPVDEQADARDERPGLRDRIADAPTDTIGLCGYCGVPRENHHHGYVSTAAANAAAPHRISCEHEQPPAPTDRAAVPAEVLPVWEAVYEPGNVSDYLIGYTNSEAAAKGAAEAWMRSQKDEVGRLEWVPDKQLATGRHDRWFELVEHHGDGVPTGPGIIVRRMADEAQQQQPEPRRPFDAQTGLQRLAEDPTRHQEPRP